jgi:hypothetical protein
MKRTLLTLNLLLLVLIAVLILAIRRQQIVRDDLYQKITRANARALEAQAAVAAQVGKLATTNNHDTGNTSAAPRTAVPENPNLPQIADREMDELSRLADERAKRQFRLNAFHGYAKGFTALNTPPETVKRAEEIILSAWQASSKLRKQERPIEEMRAAYAGIHETMEAQLIRLLGRDQFEELKAYDRQDHFDWTIGTDLWDGGAPLTSDQLHALALAAVRTNYNDQLFAESPQPSQVPDSTTGLSYQDTTLLAASARFLSATQQALLRQNLIDENRYNAAMRAFYEKQKLLWKSRKK